MKAPESVSVTDTKWKPLKKVLLIWMLICVSLFPSLPVSAESDNFVDEPREENRLDGLPEYGEDELDDRKEIVETAPFIIQSFLSLDPEVAEQEMDEDYVNYFWNTSYTAMSDSFDLFRPETILMMILNFLTSIVEIIGMIFTVFVMILYNITSTSFIATTIRSVLDSIELLLFQWDDPNSWIYRFILIGAFFSLVVKVITDRRKIVRPSQIINVFFEVLISSALVVFIGLYGRPIVNYVDDMVNEMVMVIIDQDADEPLEIKNKQIFFDTLQMQSFKIRHFGALEIEDAEYENEEGELEFVSAEERIEDLLTDQTLETAEREYNDYGNSQISHDTSSCTQVLFLSLIFLVHRILLIIVYSFICIMLGLIKILKELTLAFSIYQLIYMLFKGRSGGQRWVMDRLQWFVVAMIGNVLFTCLLLLMSSLIAKISSVHPLALIGMDVLLAAIVFLAARILPSALSQLSLKTASDVVVGNLSPQQLFREMKYGISNDPWFSDRKRNSMDQDDFNDVVPEPEPSSDSSLESLDQDKLADTEMELTDELNRQAYDGLEETIDDQEYSNETKSNTSASPTEDKDIHDDGSTNEGMEEIKKDASMDLEKETEPDSKQLEEPTVEYEPSDTSESESDKPKEDRKEITSSSNDPTFEEKELEEPLPPDNQSHDPEERSDLMFMDEDDSDLADDPQLTWEDLFGKTAFDEIESPHEQKSENFDEPMSKNPIEENRPPENTLTAETEPLPDEQKEIDVSVTDTNVSESDKSIETTETTDTEQVKPTSESLPKSEPKDFIEWEDDVNDDEES